MSEALCSYAGYNLYTKSLDDLPVVPKMVINTINQYSFCLAEKSPTFKKALVTSDILLPDGVGIVAAVKFQNGQNIKKISGSDIHAFLLEKLNKNHEKCFYLGSSEKTLIKIKARLSVEYPNIKVGYYSPPFKTFFSIEDDNKMVDEINAFRPDVLFVGMTAPKQEEWAMNNKHRLNAKIISTIGAVFDFFGGTKKRPNKFLVDMGFEWFGRLIDEPGRMWKRYLYYGPLFMIALVKYKYKSRQQAVSVEPEKSDKVEITKVGSSIHYTNNP